MRNNLLVALLILHVFASNIPVHAQDQYQENFEIVLLNRVDNDFRLRIAGYIKAAVAPLGINIIIKNLNWQNWIYHANSPGSESYDLLLGSSFNPDYSVGRFHSDGFYGLIDDPLFAGYSQSIGLDDEELVQLFLQDNGIDLHQVNDMLVDYYRETDPEIKKIKSDQLAQFYLDNILVDVPLIKQKAYTMKSKQFQRINNEHLYGSLFQGAEFVRQGDTPANVLHTSIYWIPDDRTNLVIAKPIEWTNYLVLFDSKGIPHPDLAIQWEQTDWLFDNGTTIENGKNIFLIRDDAYFEFSPAVETSFNSTKLGLKDFEFTYWLNQNSHLWWREPGTFYTGTTDYPERYVKSIIPTVEFNYTENTMTVYNPKPLNSDLNAMNSWVLYPETFFNNTILHFEETDGSYTNGTVTELVEMGKNPKFTDELLDFRFAAVMTDPYMFYGYNEDGFTHKLRDLYHFPSELDSPNQDFIVHEPGPELPYYFAYNITEVSPLQKPTTIPIDTMEFYWTDDVGQSMLDGDLDFAAFYPDNNNMDMLEKLKADTTIEMEPLRTLTSGRQLFFDLSNPHLAKYNVRKAIASVIDKDVLLQMNNGEVERWDNPVWLYYQDLYNPNIRINYDYTVARDLMWAEGYWNAETNEVNTDIPPLPTITIPNDDAIFPITPILVGLLISGWLKNRKKLN